MNEIDWEKLQELFDQAQMLESDEVDAFLQQACGGDLELKAEVLKLLKATNHNSSGFTEQISKTSQQILDDKLKGTRIGPYKIIKELGQGGMGSVFLAERADDQFEQQVAIKLISGSLKTEALAQRFIDERQILASLKHPNIALLLDGGTTDAGEPYFAMEYLQGKDIISYCDDQHLNLKQRIKLFIEVCQAVSHAHGHLILHRDIKPANILVSEAGQVKLLDFGIAKILKPDELNPKVTAQNQMIMTPEYASPEQVLGGSMSVASDVYQLGLVLYQLLTGQQAVQFKNASVAEVKSKVVDEKPLSPSQRLSQTDKQDTQSSKNIANNRSTQPDSLMKKLKGDLDTIVLKCLHKEPAQRYQAVNELNDDLKAYLELRPIKARGLTVGYRLNRYFRRHWLVVSTSTVAVLALISGLTFSLISLEQTKRAEQRAANESETANQVSQFLIDMITEAEPGQSNGETVSVLQVLEKSAIKIDQLNEQPEIQIKLLNVIGEAYMGLDAYDKAKKILQRSVDLAETFIHDDETLLIEPLYLLSIALSSRSENTISFELAKRALTIARKNNAVTAHLLVGYSTVLSNVDQHEEALLPLQEAFKLFDDKNDKSLLAEKLQVLRMLGKYHVQHGDFDLAEQYLLKGLELLDNNEGKLKSQKLRLSIMLGQLYKINLRFVEGETLLRDVITMSEEVYGEVHSETFLSYLALGSVQVRMQKLDQAQMNLDKALQLGEKTVGKTDTNYAAALREYSGLKRFQGDYIGALSLTQESTAINRKNFGDDNAQTLASQSYQLVPMLFMGRYAEALELSNMLIVKFSNIIPEDHPFMFFLYESQTKAYFGLGNYEQSRSRSEKLGQSTELKFKLSSMKIQFDLQMLWGELGLAEQQLQQMKQILLQEQKNNDPMLQSQYLNLLAQLQSAKNHPTQSIATLQNAIDILLTVRQINHPLVQKYQMSKAHQLSQNGEHEIAVQTAQASFKLWLQKIDGSENNTAILATTLAKILLNAGQNSQAIELLNEYSEKLYGALGNNHPQTLFTQCMIGEAHVQKGLLSQGEKLQEAALESLTNILGKNSPLVKSCQSKLN